MLLFAFRSFDKVKKQNDSTSQKNQSHRASINSTKNIVYNATVTTDDAAIDAQHFKERFRNHTKLLQSKNILKRRKEKKQYFNMVNYKKERRLIQAEQIGAIYVWKKNFGF